MSDQETARQDGVGDADGLDRLWTPHRIAYIRGENKPVDSTPGECPFCRIPAKDDDEGLVVRRGELAYAVLNLYPYSPGHLMVCPYRHVADYTGPPTRRPTRSAPSPSRRCRSSARSPVPTASTSG